MKELKKSALVNEKKKSRVLTEKDVFRKLDNPFIIKLHYAFQTVDKLYFILDFINGGELYSHMWDQIRFKESKVRFYACEILIGLKAMHDNGIIYRDLKPNNILIDHTGHIKLIDFGLSKIDEGGNYVAKSVVGTPNYIAPEVLRRNQHTFMVDWWSYGVLIYEMTWGEIPFLDENTQWQ